MTKINKKNFSKDLPNDANTEAYVLSQILNFNECFYIGINKLNKHHFYRKSHKALFAILQDMNVKGTMVTMLSVVDRITRTGELSEYGSIEFVQKISSLSVSGLLFNNYLSVLEDKYILRNIIVSTNNIVADCYEEREIDEIVTNLNDLAIQSTKESKFMYSASEGVSNTLDDIQEMMNSKDGNVLHKTGFVDIDDSIGGFKNGELIFIGARPRMGKTALMLSIAFKKSLFETVVIFSLEMTVDSLMARLISTLTGINNNRLSIGKNLTKDELEQITTAADVISKRNLIIIDQAGLTVEDMEAKIRALKGKYGRLGLVFIDYINIVRVKKTCGLYEKTTIISNRLKELAKNVRLPIICLSQLNRELEKRDSKKPTMADFRDSGALEQDADMLFALHRESVYKKYTEDQGVAQLILLKNRRGRAQTFDLYFDENTTAFYNITRRYNDGNSD
jgi:replicative DNA helicase